MRALSAVAAALLAAPAIGQDSETPDPLFQSNATLAVTLSAPLSTLVRERPKDDYLPGVFSYEDADGSNVSLDVDIRTRGHFRHKNCDYPPLMLNLKKDQTGGTLFDHQNKLKLVIHCDYSERYEQIVLREYLAYRILNALTDRSFRVRLLQVRYVNTEDENDGSSRYAFLIEHKNRLAQRLGLEDLELTRTSVADIQPDQLNLTSVFEFLIGNTDFSPIAGAPDNECCHNYVLFGIGEIPIVGVPYDFDQSGFVDAPYARPNPRFNLRSVKQRLYRGRCVNNEYVEPSLQVFRDKQRQIYRLVREQAGLKPYVRKEITRYIEDFYELINDPRDVERKIIEECI
jgi:hypothetical protein